MSEISIRREDEIFQCPACQEWAVPAESLHSQTLPNKVVVQGMCDICGTTRTQWVDRSPPADRTPPSVPFQG